MMNKTKIDWVDMTWNPVTGCLHGCEYCYARKISTRFGRSFKPTFHQNRLDEPAKIKKPSNIFVCSMADLFGDWVPDEWIQEVFKACEAAPWHRYLFLTKNPKRYASSMMSQVIKAPNYWFGTTVTRNVGTDGQDHFTPSDVNTFTSIEPLQRPIDFTVCGDKHFKWRSKWVIIGAETGNRKGKVVPQRKWVEDIVCTCRESGIPVFMKESLRELMGADFVQEFPWESEVKMSEKCC